MDSPLDLAKKRIPCFLCGDGLEIKTSKRAKPYLVCNICGVQIFVRGRKGISLLGQKELALRGEISVAPGEKMLEITALSNRLRELKARLWEIEINSLFTIFEEENPEKIALEAELEKIVRRLKRWSRC